MIKEKFIETFDRIAKISIACGQVFLAAS